MNLELPIGSFFLNDRGGLWQVCQMDYTKNWVNYDPIGTARKVRIEELDSQAVVYTATSDWRSAFCAWVETKLGCDVKAEYSTYRPETGTDISAAARVLIECANARDVFVSMNFNGVELSATPDMSPTQSDEIVETYRRICNERREAYLASPAYAQHLVAEAKEAERRKQLVDHALTNPPKVTQPIRTIRDHERVMRWLLHLEDVFDCNENIDGIVELLLQLGYEPNVNTDENYHAEDPDNSARYVIGQFVACRHPVVSAFIERWLDKWSPSRNRKGASARPASG